MHFSLRRAKARSLTVLAVAAFACSVAAGTAAASEVPAKWVKAGKASLSINLALKRKGGSPTTCTGSSFTNGAQMLNSGAGQGSVLAQNQGIGVEDLMVLGCTVGGNLWLGFEAIATYNTTTKAYHLTFEPVSRGWGSPYGTWEQASFSVLWLNGGTKVSPKLSELPIGVVEGGDKITATGAFSFTATNESEVTLTH